jgi:hypothetical protein
MLHELPVGAWLHEQLTALGPPSLGPRALVLVSARQPLQRLAPEGLALHPDWTIWSDGFPPPPATVAQADMIIWVMSALQMFPGEYAAVLEQARRVRIPIWAVVLGLALLDPAAQQSFVERDAAQYEAGLPPHSAVLVYRAKTPSLREVVQARVDREGTALAGRGDARRRAELRQQLIAQLRAAQQHYNAQLAATAGYTHTAQQGIAALKILLGPAVEEVLAEYRAVERTLAGLMDTVSIDLADMDSREGVPLKEQITYRVRTWHSSQYVPAATRAAVEAEVRLRTWAATYSEELQSYFASLQQTMPPGTLAQATTIDPLPVLSAAAPLLHALGEELLEAGERFVRRVHNGLNAAAPPPPEDRLLEPSARRPDPPTDAPVGAPAEPFSDPQAAPRDYPPVPPEAPPLEPPPQDDSSAFQRMARGMLRMMGDAAGVSDQFDQFVHDRMGRIFLEEVDRIRLRISKLIQQQESALITALEGALTSHAGASLQVVEARVRAQRTQLEQVLAAERLLGGDNA